MTESGPALHEWSRLYEAAIAVKEMAPWEWMTETDLFGVQNPETDEWGFISVMGILGEHLSLALYLGAEGLYDFLAIHHLADAAPAEAVLDIVHLQASFEDREILRPEDREVIKDLGLKFRGRQSWPLFRSLRAGHLPWYLEGWEARFLALALEQAMDVALRFREDPGMWDDLGDEEYLMRVPRKAEQELVWEDHIVRVPPPLPEPIAITIVMQALEEARQLPRGSHTLEVDLFRTPRPVVDEPGDRPFFPYMLLVVERESGLVVGSELLKPDPSPQAVLGLMAENLISCLLDLGSVPHQISVRSRLESQLLRPLTDELGIKVKPVRVLRSLDEAREAFEQWYV
jgi:hypothetical protein